MNKKFYELPVEKQARIKRAGYKVFGENSYKKASMKNLADEAGISKALVFHYFRNKMTLYQWLFNEAVKALNVMSVIDLSIKRDFFQLLNEVIIKRLEMMDEYQEMYDFVNRVFADAMKGGQEAIVERIQILTNERKQKILEYIDSSKFKDPLQISLLYDLLNDLATGYYYRVKASGLKNQKQIEPFLKYVDSLRQHYYKEAYL